MRSKASFLPTHAHGVVALCGALAALIAGCAQKPLCPELSDCGGPDPIGNWDLAPNYPSCMEDLYIPATDKRLTKPIVPATREPLPEPAVYDWCDLLVNGGRPTPDQAGYYNQPGFFYESGQVGQANLRINADGTYTLGFAKTGVFVLEFPEICVRQYGAMDGAPLTPGDPTSPPADVCKQLEKPIGDSGIGEGSYSNTICVANPNDPGGCLCQFDVSETGGPFGTWTRLSNNTIEFILQTNFPSKVTFCNHGGTLELTGADGDYLFGVKGLRTFMMKQTVVN
jgi:hypothetical protein